MCVFFIITCLTVGRCVGFTLQLWVQNRINTDVMNLCTFTYLEITIHIHAHGLKY